MTAQPVASRRIGTDLVDLLDRVVHRGVVVSGGVVIALAGVDLIRLDLRLLLTGVGGVTAIGGGPATGGERYR